ncbi:MAG: anaerobic ribonucleoside-triphosphate reductase activating protein [Eubacteriales bacterium]|nr:anaerobic ribonucleoside-triphosphate reductase activating protein [Eubacteriales bacterium]
MLIAGFQKLSMVDYPQKMCAVVFTPYCNFNCTYCHNYHILGKDSPLIEENEVFEYLQKRKGMLQAVVVSGGEPTLQPNLEDFLRSLKNMGYLVKLDTNGTKPELLKKLISEKLVDYIAMDIKASEGKYDELTQVSCDMRAIRRSIFYLRNTGIAHEFRTTFAPQLNKEDILELTDMIAGTEHYYLQQYRKRKDDDPEPHLPSYINETADAVRQKIGVCIVRGL